MATDIHLIDVKRTGDIGMNKARVQFASRPDARSGVLLHRTSELPSLDSGLLNEERK